jgi:hypothetical protein
LRLLTSLINIFLKIPKQRAVMPLGSITHDWEDSVR